MFSTFIIKDLKKCSGSEPQQQIKVVFHFILPNRAVQKRRKLAISLESRVRYVHP